MKKKRNAIQSIRSERVALQERAWHNSGDIELHLNARSLRRAVKTLKHRFDEVLANGTHLVELPLELGNQKSEVGALWVATTRPPAPRMISPLSSCRSEISTRP